MNQEKENLILPNYIFSCRKIIANDSITDNLYEIIHKMQCFINKLNL